MQQGWGRNITSDSLDGCCCDWRAGPQGAACLAPYAMSRSEWLTRQLTAGQLRLPFNTTSPRLPAVLLTWLQRAVVAHAAAVVCVQPQPVPHCTGQQHGQLGGDGNQAMHVPACLPAAAGLLVEPPALLLLLRACWLCGGPQQCNV